VEKLDVYIEFVESDVCDFEEEADTVVMNPPFSVHSDTGLEFVGKAVELADDVYMIANRGSREAIKDFVRNSSHEIKAVQEYTIALPATYGFHTEGSRETPVDFIITRRTE
jgi:putative methylase